MYLEHWEVLVVGHNIPSDVHVHGCRHGNKLHPLHIAIAHLKKGGTHNKIQSWENIYNIIEL